MVPQGGSVAAQINLAYLFAEGRGVPRDLIEAYCWYALAAELGHPVAVSNLAIVESELSSSEIVAAKEKFAYRKQRHESHEVPFSEG